MVMLAVNALRLVFQTQPPSADFGSNQKRLPIFPAQA